jgi:hypothetical protein
MNFSDFKEKLGAEPRETARQEQASIAQDEQRAAAVSEALAFEDKLEAALRTAPPEQELLADILAIPAGKRTRTPPVWLAMAASVLLVVGISSVFLWQQAGSQPVAEFVEYHYQHDGAQVLAKVGEGQPADQVSAVLASLGVSATPEFASQILYIKFCPTPDSQGAHMVVDTGSGPATVIFMPAVQLEEPLVLSFDGKRAEVISLKAGAAAVIGADENAMKDIQDRLREGLQPQNLDA